MKYKVGNVKDILINKDFEVFCHGVNLQGAFAAGIAGIVREVYPDCYKLYKSSVVHAGDWGPGEVLPYEVTPHKVILNAFTQILPGPNGSYDLVDKAFSTIGRVYDCKISFPLIGCGIAGLNWNVVSEIIDYRLAGKDYECIVRLDDIIKYKLLNKKS